jgi:uncharacterized protein (DUF983 family)
MAGVNPVLAGLRCRCPNCGLGALFKGFLTVSPRCGSCGLDLAKADSGDGPAVFIILIVGFIACFGALISEVRLNPPIWALLAFWLPFSAFLTLALIRPFKGVMLAMQFHHKASEAGRDDL